MTVLWMDEPVAATVIELLLHGGKPHQVPQYRLALKGVSGPLGYHEDEIEPAAGCE